MVDERKCLFLYFLIYNQIYILINLSYPFHCFISIPIEIKEEKKLKMKTNGGLISRGAEGENDILYVNLYFFFVI